MAVLGTVPGFAHEVSHPSVTVASWSADRIGPTIMAAPHRGHAHVARVRASGVVGAGALVAGVGGGEGAARTVRAQATRAVRHVLARNPDCRMRTKPRGGCAGRSGAETPWR